MKIWNRAECVCYWQQVCSSSFANVSRFFLSFCFDVITYDGKIYIQSTWIWNRLHLNIYIQETIAFKGWTRNYLCDIVSEWCEIVCFALGRVKNRFVAIFSVVRQHLSLDVMSLHIMYTNSFLNHSTHIKCGECMRRQRQKCFDTWKCFVELTMHRFYLANDMPTKENLSAKWQSFLFRLSVRKCNCPDRWWICYKVQN